MDFNLGEPPNKRLELTEGAFGEYGGREAK